MSETPTITDAEEKRFAELQLQALDYARSGNTEHLEAMLNAGMPINLQDAKGNTLLMLASYHGHEDTVRLLLDLGAAIDQRNHRGQTPLAGVAFRGNLEMVDLLLSYGADPSADQGNGQTPLSFAALFGRSDVVERLKGAGSDVRMRDRGMMAIGKIVHLISR